MVTIQRLQHHIVAAILTCSLLVPSGAAARQTPRQQPGRPAMAPSIRVRERRDVMVHGKHEVWELQWMSATTLACPPTDPAWVTCPCAGFEFSEAGRLDLVRLRDNREIDRLHLTPFFANYDLPLPPSEQHLAVLPRWTLHEGTDVSDYFRADSASPATPDSSNAPSPLEAFSAAIFRREPPMILALADLNQDGDSTEFVLQVGNA